MRTSAGFREMGLSGKMRIQIRPPRLIWRVMARRAASIWRAVRRPRPVAFRPYSPKLTLLPRVATPVFRPFCSLRYLRLAGCSTFYSCLCSCPSRLACGSGFLGRRSCRRGKTRMVVLADYFALEHPDLDADDPVAGLGFRESIVDIGAQGMQRDAA